MQRGGKVMGTVDISAMILYDQLIIISMIKGKQKFCPLFQSLIAINEPLEEADVTYNI